MSASKDLEVVFQLFCDHESKTWKYMKCDWVPEEFVAKALQVAIDHYKKDASKMDVRADQSSACET